MKRFVFIFLMAVILFGCGKADEKANADKNNNDNNTVEAEETNTDNEDVAGDNDASEENMSSDDTSMDLERQGTLDEDDVDKVYSDPLKYEGYEMSFDGQVFVEPERHDDGIYLQVFADPENHEKNTIVAVDDAGFDVDMDDYVHVEGVVFDEFEGANAVGGDVVAPAVFADNIEVVDYATAISPVLETIEVDETIEQHGYEMYVEKVEIAENMTRVYAKVTNNTGDNISFYSFDSKLLIDNQQLEEEMGFYEADFPELQSDILPDMETEGVIIFPPVDSDTDSMTFHAEGSSHNYELDFEPFVFEIEK